MIRVRFIIALGLALAGVSLEAAENIVLTTGFSLAADRHEVDGGTLRVYSGSGVTEMPARMVASVEVLPDPEPVKAAVSEPAVVAVPTPTVDPVPASPRELAESAARKYALPDAFVAGVMKAESGFNPAARSPKGAIGLMQLMPGTAKELGADAAKPVENADAGARYLRDLLARYEDRPDQVLLALAAYNAGPAAVEKYHGVPPYRETHQYILRVLKAWNSSPTLAPVQ